MTSGGITRYLRAIARAQVLAAGCALLAFLVYLRTLAPTVDFIDAGELTTVACTLGIAHPTGYPLFTLLGWVFSKLPIAAAQVVRLNIMAAFFCSAGVYVFFHVVHLLLCVSGRRNHGTASNRVAAPDLPVLLASAGAALLLAFSETYWSQAVAVEVYSLHVFFLSVTAYAFLRANAPALRREPDQAVGRRPSAETWWYAFAFSLGLSFTNHMTTILLAPGFLFLYFAVQGVRADSWNRIAGMSLPFLAGLSLYLYLPVRGSEGPVMNWGNPVNLERFLWHFTGKQYRVWLFSSSDVASKQFRYFLDTLPSEFAYVGLALAVAGVVSLWLAHRKLAVWSLLLFVGCVAYSINYDIHDIDSYFLLAYFAMALWMGCALFAIAGWVFARYRYGTAVSIVVVIVLSIAPLFYHFSRSDESDNYLVEDYTRNVFGSLEPGALILSTQWDFWVSASYYYQIVQGYRPDVIVVDKELLRRSWYFLQLERRQPSLISRSRAEVDAFLRELDKFEHDMPRNTYLAIQPRYVAMILSFISRNIATRPVYVTWEIERELTQGYQRVPEGLAYRLYPDTLFHPTPVPAFTYRPYSRSGRLEDAVKQLYGLAFAARGEYYLARGRLPAEAESAFKSALSFDPGSIAAQRGLASLPH